MKKILITGAGSYIGTSFERWMKQAQFAGQYEVDTIDMQGEEWKKKDFSGYDSVFHVAGIAHQKETKKNAQLYFTVNRDLAIDVAKKARNAGVSQFVLLSSMSVYGILEGVISTTSEPNPKSCYGKSKYEAEMQISKMLSDKFSVAILRPPMVYGLGCKGNYQLLRNLAIITPFFSSIKNKRSMIYVDNLSEYVRKIIEDEQAGVFFPQNKEYISTWDMVSLIAELHCKKIIKIDIFNSLIEILNIPLVKKVFGNLIYDIEPEFNCKMVSFEESIKKTEGL